MAAVEVIRILIVLLAVASVNEAFRLRARFPRPQRQELGHHAKRHICRYCIYETRTIRQKASQASSETSILIHNRLLTNKRLPVCKF